MAHLDRQNRSPEVLRLPDQRLRVTRRYTVQNQIPKDPAVLLSEVWLPWGTADEKFTDCRLIKQDIGGQAGPYFKPVDEPPVLIRVYEEISATGETAVGNADVQIGQDDLITVSQSYLAFSAGTATYQIPGVTAAPAPWDTQCILKIEERTDDGTLQRIKRTYISKGLITQSDETKFDGALLLRTLTYVNEVPPTPSGYTVVNTQVQFPNGLPVYTYTFAKGTGQISYREEYLVSPDAGTTGITEIIIRYISVPTVDTCPITQPAGTVVMNTQKEDQDGYRIWTQQFNKGTGIIQSRKEYRNNGKLVIYSVNSINAVPTTPAATIGGTVVLIQAESRNGSRFDPGVVMYDYAWAEGEGLIEQRIHVRNDGLREQTYISLGTKETPYSGLIIVDEQEEISGVTKYTVTAMQSANGGDPTGAAITLPRDVHWTYPGRAKAYDKTLFSTWHALDVFLSPPIELILPGTVTITYQQSGTLGALMNPRWQPTSWATIEAAYYGLGGYPKFHIEALRGYRSVSDTPLTHTYGSLDTNGGTMIGQTAYGGSDGVLTCYGGPEDPDNNTYVLQAELEVAFQTTNGTFIYRKTVVTVTVPAQPALPI